MSKRLNLSWAISLSLIALSCFMFGFLVQIGLFSNFFNSNHEIKSLRSDIRIKNLSRRDEEFSLKSERNDEIKSSLETANNKLIHKNFLDLEDGKNSKIINSVKFSSKTPVPNIVKAWREGKVDWHTLIPKHNSIWERFGTPQKEYKLPLLVSKEIQVTDYLTRFHESGLSSKYGHEYGNMLGYSGCNIFSSTCMIHDYNSCNTNDFCFWDDLQRLCVDLDNTNYVKSHISKSSACKNPKVYKNNRFEDAKPSECKAYISQPIILITLDSESQSMYYHFYSSWTTIYDYWLKKLDSNRNIHFIIPEINDPMFFIYFGLISNFCWNRQNILSSLPSNVCYCEVKSFTASQILTNQVEAANYVVEYLQLNSVVPPIDKVKIGIISRRRKRFILNEYELVETLESLGYECILLPLETMTLYEQMLELRSLDILVGIHGSALDNSVFLHPGSVMIQLLPYTVEHRVTFASSANAANVVYMEWQLKDPSKAVFHWDLLDQANSEKLKKYTKEQILSMGQTKSDNRETLMFWINQDIIVSLNEWEQLIKGAVKKSNANKRGL